MAYYVKAAEDWKQKSDSQGWYDDPDMDQLMARTNEVGQATESEDGGFFNAYSADLIAMVEMSHRVMWEWFLLDGEAQHTWERREKDTRIMINWAYYEPLEAPVIPPGRQVECEKGMAKDEQAEAETMEQEKKDVQEIENNEKNAESERRAVVLTQFDVQAQDKVERTLPPKGVTISLQISKLTASYRHSQSPDDHVRFSAARMAFHRVVRSSQRACWTHWQDHVSAPSHRNPRKPASKVRRTFQVPGQVAFFPVGESLAHWRDHFVSVGASPDGSYDEDFFHLIARRFEGISCSCRSPGIFDAPFSHSELRGALSHCVDSAVCLDGLPYLLFKVKFPWWPEATLNFSCLVFP